VSLSDAYGCLSGDVVMEYCFAKNHNFLEFPDFHSPFLKAVYNSESSIHVLMHFPWLLPLVKALPESLLPSQFMLIFNFQKV